MKTLHYILNFLPQSETFIYDLIKSLDSNNIDCCVVAHTKDQIESRAFPKVRYFPENASIFKKLYFKLFKPYHIKNDAQIVHYIYEEIPQLIHAHFGPNGLRIYNLLEKYNLNIPLIVSFHGYDINVLPKENHKYLQSIIDMSQSTHVRFTSPSNFLKNKMIKLGIDSEKIHILPNAYNSIFETIEKKEYWQYGDTLKLINIGRFEEVKGQKYLIRALKKVVAYYPKCSLTLIGYGSLQKELQTLSEKLGLKKNIVFLEKVEHNKLPSILAQHDIYIQPSVIAKDGAEESLSVSTIEAQTTGLPAIVSDIGGLPEVVTDKETGFVVKEKNEDQIYEMIKFYIDNPEVIQTHSKNAISASKKKFNQQKILADWINLYRSSTQYDNPTRIS